MQIPWPSVAVFIAAIAAIQTLRLWLLRRRPSQRAQTRSLRAVAGEGEAEKLLTAIGYRIVARQPRTRVRLWVDGRPVEVEVRGDLLVRRGARRYLAEVKTGQRAPRITHGPTRRQLLEYRHAFEVDGLLLVDADRREVHEIAFEAPSSRGLLARLLGA